MSSHEGGRAPALARRMGQVWRRKTADGRRMMLSVPTHDLSTFHGSLDI